MINGILNVKKEPGYTSHDVVAKLRGIVKQKKIGHTGTLDPDASGVLPVCLGKATRLCGAIGDWDKTYEAVLLLGRTTDTEDTTGAVTGRFDVTVTPAEIREIILSFVGPYGQVPPMYSAKKVGGKKLYELAREGVVIERKACPVSISSIDILDITLPCVRFSVTCSKGTYIRSLCRDIGEKAGCGGCMSELVRTRVAGFRLEEALTLSEIQSMNERGLLADHIHRIDSVFLEYPSAAVHGKAEKIALNGGAVRLSDIQTDAAGKPGCMLRLYDSAGHFIGLYQRGQENIRPHKLFFDMT